MARFFWLASRLCVCVCVCVCVFVSVYLQLCPAHRRLFFFRYVKQYRQNIIKVMAFQKYNLLNNLLRLSVWLRQTDRIALGLH